MKKAISILGLLLMTTSAFASDLAPVDLDLTAKEAELIFNSLNVPENIERGFIFKKVGPLECSVLTMKYYNENMERVVGKKLDTFKCYLDAK